MARLAEYMQQLALIFGETQSVHFDRIEKACTKLVARLDMGVPAQRVHSRVYAVRDRKAPAEAMNAFRRLDEMVGEDRGNARLTFGANVILRFPGRINILKEPFSLIDEATVVGKLYALSEEPSGDGLRARIRPRGGSSYIACTADGDIARTLGNYFLDTIRAYGRGKWERSDSGEWACKSLHIRSVDPVKDVSLREAINELREIKTDWPEDPLEEWALLDEKDGAA
ncbi:MAG: hypothetical protein EPN75_13230 [Beijerinckiaceae bacterium]|nr:MAG: hypothetical protein EPN75_13230 [Beijerinckiaceae bacterium]